MIYSIRYILACATALCIAIIIAAPASCASPADTKGSELVSRAAALFQRGEHERALPLLEEALSLSPSDPLANRYMALYRGRLIEPFCKQAAEAYFAGDYATAIRNWELAVSASPSSIKLQRLIEDALERGKNHSLELLYSNAEASIKQAEFSRAASELEKIIAEYPEENRARDMLSSLSDKLDTALIQSRMDKARGFLEAGDHKAAEKELEEVLSLDQRNSMAQRLLVTSRKQRLSPLYSEADSALKAGDYSKTSSAYSRIIDANPTDASARASSQKLDEVMRVVPSVMTQSKAGHAVRMSIYHYVGDGGDPKISLAGAWYASQLEPRSSIVQAVLELIEARQSHVIRYMEQPSRETTVVEQYLYSALNHIYEGRYDIAAEECSLVLAISPDNVLALKRSGSANYMMGRRDKAGDAWKRALELAPDDKELRGFIEMLK